MLVGSSTSCYRIIHRKIRISVCARARLNAVSILLVCTLSVIDLAMMRIRLLADIHWPSHGHFCRDPSFREVRLASWDQWMDTLSPSCEESPLPEVHLVWPLGMKGLESRKGVVEERERLTLQSDAKKRTPPVQTMKRKKVRI